MAYDGDALYFTADAEYEPGRLFVGGSYIRTAPVDEYHSAIRAIDPVSGTRRWEFEVPSKSMSGIAGHRVTVHCTVTGQQARRTGYLEEFVSTWSAHVAVDKILVSLYTPQVGETSEEMLTPEERARVVADLLSIRQRFTKVAMPIPMVESYAEPPASPEDCVFAKTTTCVSADFQTQIGPCQFGGTPDCSQCGCAASAGLSAMGRHELPGGLRVKTLLDASLQVGDKVETVRAIFQRRDLLLSDRPEG